MKFLHAAILVLARGATAWRLTGAHWALIDQCLVSGAVLVTILLFARYLDTAVVGAFMLAYTGLVLLSSIQRTLLKQPRNVLAAALERTAYRRFAGAPAVLLAISCLILCATLVLAGWLIGVFSPAAGSVLIALAVTVAPWTGQAFVRKALRARGETRAAAINDAVTCGLQLFGALVLVTAAAHWATPGSALWVLALSSAVGFALGCWQLGRAIDVKRPDEVTPCALLMARRPG